MTNYRGFAKLSDLILADKGTSQVIIQHRNGTNGNISAGGFLEWIRGNARYRGVTTSKIHAIIHDQNRFGVQRRHNQAHRPHANQQPTADNNNRSVHQQKPFFLLLKAVQPTHRDMDHWPLYSILIGPSRKSTSCGDEPDCPVVTPTSRECLLTNNFINCKNRGDR